VKPGLPAALSEYRGILSPDSTAIEMEIHHGEIGKTSKIGHRTYQFFPVAFVD
jgi:hypothetical protein